MGWGAGSFDAVTYRDDVHLAKCRKIAELSFGRARISRKSRRRGGFKTPKSTPGVGRPRLTSNRAVEK